MRIIIAGGGTGGHIFPAVSIAEEIMKRSDKNEVLFVGTDHGMEKKIVPGLGFNLATINSRGIAGKGYIYKLRSMISALRGLFSSFRILRKFKPDLVLGVGGYVSGPTVLSAYLSFIPTAICEQNMVPGITNRILSKFSKKIFVTFRDSKKYFPESKVIVTGNPLRSGLVDKAKEKVGKSDGLNLLIIGGSQGAARLNNTIPGALAGLKTNGLKVIHQTGKDHEESVKESYRKLGIEAEVHTFIEDIADCYKNSNLIISRSGAGAISEITAFGKASVLVPFPYAAHNHQLLNAKFMEKEGASVLIEEKELTEDYLKNKLDALISKSNIEAMSRESARLGMPGAAKDIVEQLYSLTGK